MVVVLLVQLAVAADVAVPLDQLPAAVKSAVLARFPGATLLAAEREGRTYDVELRTPANEHWEAEVATDGTIREVERKDHDDKGDKEESGEKEEHDD